MVLQGVSPSCALGVEHDTSIHHDVHVAYGDLSVSGPVAVLRIRMFGDDLALALERRLEASGADEVTTTPFLAYFREQFVLEADGTVLEPKLVGSGEDVMGGEPVAWYILRFDSERDIGSLRVVNRVLFDMFDDQRNLLNVVDEPSTARRVFYLTPDQDAARFDIPSPGSALWNMNDPDSSAFIPLNRRAMRARPIDQVLDDLSAEFTVG